MRSARFLKLAFWGRGSIDGEYEKSYYPVILFVFHGLACVCGPSWQEMGVIV